MARRARRTVNRDARNVEGDSRQPRRPRQDDERHDKGRDRDRDPGRGREDQLVNGFRIEVVERCSGVMLADLMNVEMPVRHLPMVTGVGRHVMDVLIRQHRKEAHSQRDDDRQEAGETTHPDIIGEPFPVEVSSERA